ncbi:unnamed protein product [Effrenium voratum]|nr:unnamed protein product [Effrenium voratum]
MGMTEVLGINAKDMGVSANAAEAWWLVGGCENKLGNTFEERQCMQPGFIPECHVIMEMWKNPLTGLIKEYDTWNADLAPVVAKELSYAGSEFLSVFPKAIDLAAQDGIALNFYQSWNASWSNMSRYFSRITDIDFAELANCSAMYKLKVTSFLDTFEEVTGYQGAVVNGEFVCWQDKWLLGPGCRDPDRPELCVPFITAFGWLAESSIQKIFAYNTAMAYGEANTWGLYLDIPRRHDVVVYWWSPDSNFKDMNPSKVIFPGPRCNSVAWGNMQRTAQYPESILVTVLNRALVENSDEWNAKAVKLSKRIDITNPEMDAAMLGLYEKTVANGWSYANFFNEACEFIKETIGARSPCGFLLMWSARPAQV